MCCILPTTRELFGWTGKISNKNNSDISQKKKKKEMLHQHSRPTPEADRSLMISYRMIFQLISETIL